jgi:hypothetical protein
LSSPYIGIYALRGLERFLNDEEVKAGIIERWDKTNAWLVRIIYTCFLNGNLWRISRIKITLLQEFSMSTAPILK